MKSRQNWAFQVFNDFWLHNISYLVFILLILIVSDHTHLLSTESYKQLKDILKCSKNYYFFH